MDVAVHHKSLQDTNQKNNLPISDVYITLYRSIVLLQSYYHLVIRLRAAK